MIAFLFLAGTLGGALNSVAGGGSFIGLPALMFAGISPVGANATTTLALWPGAVASALAYRHDIGVALKPLAAIGGVSVIGGLIGAELLVRTSNTLFLRLLPWLMLVASMALALGGRLRRHETNAADVQARLLTPSVVITLFAVAVYGGYFGGGIGIMTLATLSLAGMKDIHEMNGLKSIFGAAINGVALAEFAARGVVSWEPGLVMVAGGVVGGWAGAAIARRSDPKYVRLLAVLIGWGMTIYYFIR